MGDLGFLGVAGLGEDCEEDDRAAGREAVGDAGLLGKQVEPQFADLASQVADVGLAKTFCLLGEQSERKSARPKSRSLRRSSQDRTSGSTSTAHRPAMPPMLYASDAIANPGPCSWTEGSSGT